MLNDNDGKPQGNMLRYIDGIFIEENDQTTTATFSVLTIYFFLAHGWAVNAI